MSFSAPRQTLDGTVHEPSSLFLDIAAALRRPNVETGKFDPKYLRASSVRRDYFGPGMLERAEGFKMLVARPSSKDIGEFLDADASTRPGPLDGLLREKCPRPKKMSASSLGTLLTCPHKFLYEKLLGWEEPPTLPETNALDALTFGKLFHSVMESFFTKNGEDFYAHRQTLKMWITTAQQEGHRQFEELIRFYPLVGKDFRMAQRERLDADIDSIIRYEWEREPQVRIACIEEPFGADHALDLAGLPFKGYIDRVDIVDGKSFVRDFKTGRAHVRKENEPPDPVRDVQLAVYSLALTKLAKEKGIPSPAGAEYFYPRGAASRAFLREDFAALLKHGREWLSLAAGLLDENSFPRTPDKDDCQYCAFRPVCGENFFSLNEKKLEAAGGSAAKFLSLKRPPEADVLDEESEAMPARNASTPKSKKRVTRRAG